MARVVAIGIQDFEKIILNYNGFENIKLFSKPCSVVFVLWLLIFSRLSIIFKH